MRFPLRLSHACAATPERPAASLAYRRSVQQALSFSLRTCATLRSSGRDPASGGHQQTRTAETAYTALLIPLWPYIRRIPSLHAPPGAAAFYVSAHRGQVIAATASATMSRRASCPFSGAVRRSRLPGIASLHSHLPHGGRDPPARIVGWYSPAAYKRPAGVGLRALVSLFVCR